MKTIIAGSRDIEDYELLKRVMQNVPWEITEVISGGYKGVDTLAIRWAEEKKIPCIVMKANWTSFGPAAGPIRNSEMAKVGEALVLVWDGHSKGSKDILARMRKKRTACYVFNCELNVGNLHKRVQTLGATHGA